MRTQMALTLLETKKEEKKELTTKPKPINRIHCGVKP